MKSIARIIGWSVLAVFVAGSAIWAVLALLYAGPASQFLRYGSMLVVAFACIAALTGLARRRWRGIGIGAYLILFTVVLFWWGSIEPLNARDWQTDVAVLASASVDGDIVTVRNIRNFDYHSETDYTPSYYDRSFDLRELQGVDVVAVHWMGPLIAHVFLSFSFNNGEHLAFSIETRKERGEGYSTIEGFFRRYELYYVVADERDVIRLRTNFRRNPPEDVYVYRAAGAIEDGRRLFLEYINQINALNTSPEFYNTLTTNCTTTIWMNTRVNAQHLPLDWKVLVSGYLPQFLYEQGRLQTDGLSFSELQEQAHVNTRALNADDAVDFSNRIRAPIAVSKYGAEVAP